MILKVKMRIMNSVYKQSFFYRHITVIKVYCCHCFMLVLIIADLSICLISKLKFIVGK